MNKTYDYIVKSGKSNLVATFDSNKDSYILDDLLKNLKVKNTDELNKYLKYLGCKNIDVTEATEFDIKNHKETRIKEILYAIGFVTFLAISLFS